MNLNERETATVLAALRQWQSDFAPEDGWKTNEAYDEGPLTTVPDNKRDHFFDHQPLTESEIDDLCERINFDTPPTVIVFVDGGLVNGYESDQPVRVITRDYDIDPAILVDPDTGAELGPTIQTDEDGNQFVETEI